MTTLATTGLRVDSRALSALVAACLGLAIFLSAGFAWPETLHNATHDVRHSLGLPCH